MTLDKGHNVWKVYTKHSIASQSSYLTYAGSRLLRVDVINNIHETFKNTELEYLIIENNKVIFSRLFKEVSIKKLLKIHFKNKYNAKQADRLSAKMDLLKEISE